jgi:integrase
VTERRSRGEGGLSWSESRQRWIGRVSVGFTAMGKRRVVTVSGRTKTEAKAKLREVMRDHQDGFPTERRHRTVAEAVEDWLAHGMGLQEPSTVVNRAILARTHLVPVLGRRRLVELTVHDVDAWLADRATMLSTDTVQRLHGILRAVLHRAQAHDHVKRNVALLVDPPRGTAGRPSKALTADQAARLLAAAEADEAMRAYVVVSLLTGARTEELRALTWTHVDLEGKPPTVALWRSVRAGGETKTRQSRRTLELPARAAEALRAHRTSQRHVQLAAGDRWQGAGLVFCTSVGTALDAANVRRSFRRVAAAAGLDAQAWTPRELRHSFVSLLSSTGMSIEDISHLVGHASSRVTELVYRKELRPVLTRGASAMDALFPHEKPGA